MQAFILFLSMLVPPSHVECSNRMDMAADWLGAMSELPQGHQGRDEAIRVWQYWYALDVFYQRQNIEDRADWLGHAIGSRIALGSRIGWNLWD